MSLSDKPVLEESEGPGSPPPYKMIQTIGLSVGAAVAYIIAVLGLMFYCKKRCKAKRLQKQPEGEEPEMECLNGEGPWRREAVPPAGAKRPPVAVEESAAVGAKAEPHPPPSPAQAPPPGWQIPRASASGRAGSSLPHWILGLASCVSVPFPCSSKPQA